MTQAMERLSKRASVIGRAAQAVYKSPFAKRTAFGAAAGSLIGGTAKMMSSAPGEELKGFGKGALTGAGIGAGVGAGSSVLGAKGRKIVGGSALTIGLTMPVYKQRALASAKLKAPKIHAAATPLPTYGERMHNINPYTNIHKTAIQLKTPIALKKMAGIADTIIYNDERINDMYVGVTRNPYTGEIKKGHTPINMREFRKIVLENADKYISEQEKNHSEAMKRYYNKEKIPMSEHMMNIAGKTLAGGVGVGILGALYGAIKNKPIKGAAIGALTGAALGALDRGKVFKGRPVQGYPGNVPDIGEAYYIRDIFSRPYTGKGERTRNMNDYIGVDNELIDLIPG